MVNSKHGHNNSNLYAFYIITSLVFGCLVTILSLYSSPNTWHDFYNSKPQRGDMGFGKFLIRGSRVMDGKL
jgi:hypothetical protein